MMSPIILIILVTAYHHGATGQSLCTTVTEITGTCMSLEECQSFGNLNSLIPITVQDFFIKKSSNCVSQGNDELMCCPKACQTPNKTCGECKKIDKCKELLEKSKPPLSSEDISFLNNSRCENAYEDDYCCPLPDKGNCEQRNSAFPPDPRSECCGVMPVVRDITTLAYEQYPWQVYIEYMKDGSLKMLRGATLISGKYVLTAGQCVTGAILDSGTPTNIRFTEYYTNEKDAYCSPVEAGGKDCSYGVKTILIEKIIVHPDYNPTDRVRRNDIALLRMTEMARYTDFIRPACLPLVDYTSMPPNKFDLFLPGWRALNSSSLKSRVKVPYVTPEVCQKEYQKRGISLGEKHLCAGKDKDTCKDNVGGPLLYNSGRTFEAIGIDSSGALPCGSEDVPGVYTKVYPYKDWIMSNITP